MNFDVRRSIFETKNQEQIFFYFHGKAKTNVDGYYVVSFRFCCVLMCIYGRTLWLILSDECRRLVYR